MDLRSKKAQALLIYLALTAKPHTREHLATLLWGDRFDDQARRSLRQAVFALRKAVGADVVVGEDALSLRGIAVKSDKLGVLLENYPAVSDQFDIWLRVEREKTYAVTRDTLISASCREFEAGRFADALAMAEKLLALDPVNEEALRTAMQALSQLNRRTEALMRFEKFASLLRTELEAEPSAKTSALAERLRTETKPLGRTNVVGASPHIVFVPFEDLGGGETTSFFARDLPEAISNLAALSEWVAIVPAVAVEEKYPDGANPLEAARAFGGEMLVTGSVKQIGSKIRVSIQSLDLGTAKTIWSHVEIIDEKNAFEAFDILASLAFNGAWQALRSITFQFDVLDQLQQERNSPAAFLATLQRLFSASYSQEHTRRSMSHWLLATEYAVKCFPKNAVYQGFYALAIFGNAHMSDGKDRVEKYRLSQEIANRAIALRSGGPASIASAMQETIWLGEHKKAEELFNTLPNPAVTAAHNGIFATSLAFQGRCEEAMALLSQTIHHEAGSALLFYRNASLAVAHFSVGGYDKAVQSAKNAVDGNAEYFMGHLVLIAGLEISGDHAAAKAAVKNFSKNYRDPTVTEFEFLPFTDLNVKSLFLSALRDAGLPE